MPVFSRMQHMLQHMFNNSSTTNQHCHIIGNHHRLSATSDGADHSDGLATVPPRLNDPQPHSSASDIRPIAMIKRSHTGWEDFGYN